MRLSAIIIAKNEAGNIADCLDSVAFCDERIVVDGGSDDGTVALAEAKGARVVSSQKWNGYGPQKNFALSLAGGDWVLSLDADERVSAALAREIQQTIPDAYADGYKMSRLSSFCGRQMRHSGWYPDYVLRLFRRGKARFSDDIVHERVICDGPVARLTAPLLHSPMARLEEALAKLDRYSTAGAAKRISSGSGLVPGLFAFFRAYVLRAGFLDGREGFLLAVTIAEGSYYRYMKAWMKVHRRSGPTS